MRTNLNYITIGFGNINYVTTMKWNTKATVKKDVQEIFNGLEKYL